MPESLSQSQLVWLSLDVDDNDPIRFSTYMVAALSNAVPDLFRFVDVLRSAPQPGTAKAVISAIINDLARDWDAKTQIVLAIDDYHVIEAKAVNDIAPYSAEAVFAEGK